MGLWWPGRFARGPAAGLRRQEKLCALFEGRFFCYAFGALRPEFAQCPDDVSRGRFPVPRLRPDTAGTRPGRGPNLLRSFAEEVFSVQISDLDSTLFGSAHHPVGFDDC